MAECEGVTHNTTISSTTPAPSSSCATTTTTAPAVTCPGTSTPLENTLPQKNTKRLPRVVKLRRHNNKIVQGCDIYIGRECKRGGWDLPSSKWANPFTLASVKDGAANKRHTVIDLYRQRIVSRPDLLLALPELEGKTLGCWYVYIVLIHRYVYIFFVYSYCCAGVPRNRVMEMCLCNFFNSTAVLPKAVPHHLPTRVEK